MATTTDAPAFIAALADLAGRFSEHRIELQGLRYSSDLFGGWECEWARYRRRIRVTWDGKDQHLVVATAELAAGSKQRQWQVVEDHDFRGRRAAIADLMRTAEAAIAAHGGSRAGGGSA